jgi:hypothetical protein
MCTHVPSRSDCVVPGGGTHAHAAGNWHRHDTHAGTIITRITIEGV